MRRRNRRCPTARRVFSRRVFRSSGSLNRVTAEASGKPRPAPAATRSALLEETLARLPAELRLVFLLREAEGLPVPAIARDLGLNPITVRTRPPPPARATPETCLRGGFDTVFPFDGACCARMADRVVEALRESERR